MISMRPVCFDGRVVVVRATEAGSVGLRVLTDLLAGLDEEFADAPVDVPIHFIVDISPCLIPTSMFLGFLGYMVGNKKPPLRDVVIVGASDETRKRMRQFGLIPTKGTPDAKTKIHLVSTVEQGFAGLLAS